MVVVEIIECPNYLPTDREDMERAYVHKFKYNMITIIMKTCFMVKKIYKLYTSDPSLRIISHVVEHVDDISI